MKKQSKDQVNRTMVTFITIYYEYLEGSPYVLLTKLEKLHLQFLNGKVMTDINEYYGKK